MRRKPYSDRAAYQKAVLAVYQHSEDDAPWTAATNDELCRSAGIGRTSLRLALAEMERKRLIASFAVGTRVGIPSGRVLVLLDHPESVSWVDTWQGCVESVNSRRFDVARAAAMRNCPQIYP